MGNDGIGMGNAQRITKSCLGLLFSRSGVKQGNLDRTRSAKKCRKKDLMQLVFVSYTRSVFLLLSGCQRMQLFAPGRMRGVALRHVMTLYDHYNSTQELQQLKIFSNQLNLLVLSSLEISILLTWDLVGYLKSFLLLLTFCTKLVKSKPIAEPDYFIKHPSWFIYEFICLIIKT